MFPIRNSPAKSANAPIAAALYLLVLLGIAGCASNTPAPVVNRDQGQKTVPRGIQKGPTTHQVQKGETLYSIAWRYDLDYQRLARWNGIDSAYRIYPGQLLRLKSPSSTAYLKPATREKPPEPKPVVKKSTSATKPAVKDKPRATASGDTLKWVWPTSGTVVQKFKAGDRTRQGIRIAGKVGQPVVAAESGKVVYTGSGLPGYGKLIIVKHNKNYLSAYGFNRKLLVKDGVQVARGDRLAEMGQSTDGKPLLHFEIRRRDKPLDPLKRLPSR